MSSIRLFRWLGVLLLPDVRIRGDALDLILVVGVEVDADLCVGSWVVRTSS